MPETENPVPTAQPDHVLVVRQPFGGYVRGDEITDPELVSEILASEWAENVVKRAG